MIGRLQGILITRQPSILLIDVQGVGYEVWISLSTFEKIPAEGEKIILLIHHVVREDAHILYGFYAETERYLFRELIKVSGVGPKLALTILSGIEPHVFMQCIEAQDTTSLVALPGIGKKTAARLLVEMRDRLQYPTWTPTAGNTVNYANASMQQEAIHALLALGYKPQEALTAVNRFADKVDSVEALLRAVLKGDVLCPTND